MSGFLANLAGLALGQPSPGAARLSLPPRFSGGGSIETDAQPEQVESVPAAAVHPPSSAQPPKRLEDRPQIPIAALVNTAEVPVSPLPERPARPIASPTTVQAMPRRPIEGEVHDRPQPSPLNATQKMEPIHSASETAAARPTDPIRGETIVRHVRSDPASPHVAPLTHAALANRSVVNREPPPVVNVTIDRLEVLAPRETAKPQTTRRTRPQPSISLADYLGTRS